MILESLIDVCLGVLYGLFDMLELYQNSIIYSQNSLLYDAVSVLSEFCVYGSYVVGADFMLIFSSLIVMCATAKLTVGIGVRLWELLPLT